MAESILLFVANWGEWPSLPHRTLVKIKWVKYMKHLNPSVAGDINSFIIIAGTGHPLNFLYTFVHTH